MSEKQTKKTKPDGRSVFVILRMRPAERTLCRKRAAADGERFSRWARAALIAAATK